MARGWRRAGPGAGPAHSAPGGGACPEREKRRRRQQPPPAPQYLRVHEHDLVPRRLPQDAPHSQVRQRESCGGALSDGPAIFLLLLLLPFPLRLRALRHGSSPPPHCARAAPHGALGNRAPWRLGGPAPPRLLLPQKPEPEIETKIRKTNKT